MSEATGQKHTEIPENPMGKYVKNPERYRFENKEWWYYYPNNEGSTRSDVTCRERVSTIKKRNDNRMFVDGKYVSKTHPLYKPGRYSGFSDVAFSALEGYSKSKTGYIYVMHNPAFPGWVKVGMAVDAEDRIKQFQTGSPYRDYELVKSYKVSDRREAESKAHAALTVEGRGRKGEWFYMGSNVAVAELDKIFPAGEQLELF